MPGNATDPSFAPLPASAFAEPSKAPVQATLPVVPVVSPTNASGMTEKVKEYESMLETLLKKGDFVQMKNLAQELKTLDPHSATADEWLKKAENQGKAPLSPPSLSTLQEELKQAFERGRFDQVADLAKKIELLDKGNALARNYMERINHSEAMPGVKKTSWFSGLLASLQGKGRKFLPKFPSLSKAPVVQTQPSSESTSKQNPVKKLKKGNLFTRIFSPQQVEKSDRSVIDAIVDRKAADEQEQKKKLATAGIQKIKDKAGKLGLLTFSKALFHFVLVFSVVSAGFLYVEVIDKDNAVLGLFGVSENYASALHHSASEIERLDKEKVKLEEEVSLYQKGYNNDHQEMVTQIMGARLNWPDVLAKINEVANSVYELNDFFQYIKFNNFSFDVQTRQISLTGSLSDPAGRNLTRMVDLEEAFMSYPGEPGQSNSSVKPYFTDFKPFTAYSKSYSQADGEFVSRFSLSFKLNE